MGQPTIGRIVIFRARDHAVPAIVTGTMDTLPQALVERGDMAALSSEMHVHLHVLSPSLRPGERGGFEVFDVAFAGGEARGWADEQMEPDTWAWPARGSVTTVGRVTG